MEINRYCFDISFPGIIIKHSNYQVWFVRSLVKIFYQMAGNSCLGSLLSYPRPKLTIDRKPNQKYIFSFVMRVVFCCIVFGLVYLLCCLSTNELIGSYRTRIEFLYKNPYQPQIHCFVISILINIICSFIVFFNLISGRGERTNGSQSTPMIFYPTTSSWVHSVRFP